MCQWSVVQILQECQIAKELWALEKLCVFNLRPGLDRKRRGLEPTKQNCGEESPVVVLAVLTFSTVRGWVLPTVVIELVARNHCDWILGKNPMCSCTRTEVKGWNPWLRQLKNRRPEVLFLYCVLNLISNQDRDGEDKKNQTIQGKEIQLFLLHTCMLWQSRCLKKFI